MKKKKLEYPTGSQSYDFSAINKNKNRSVGHRNENKTLLDKLIIIGYWYRLRARGGGGAGGGGFSLPTFLEILKSY